MSAGGQRAKLPLHEAVLSGREEAVRAALVAGAQLDAVDAGGRTALHLAAHRRYPDPVRRLLKAGADPRRRDTLLGWTPLRYLDEVSPSWNDAMLLEVAEMLLEAGANPEDLEERFVNVTYDTFFPYSEEVADLDPGILCLDCPKLTLAWLRYSRVSCGYLEALEGAATRTWVKTTRALLDNGCYDAKHSEHSTDAQEELEQNALTQSHLCPLGGDHREVELLTLENALKYKDVKIAACFSENCWHSIDPFRFDAKVFGMAVIAGKLGPAEKFLKIGTDVRVKLERGKEPLHYVLLNPFSLDCDTLLRAVRLLLSYGADANCKDDEGNLALNAAASTNIKVLELLLSEGGNVHDCDAGGRGLLHYARDAETVNFLTGREVDHNVRDELGGVAAHTAAKLGRVSALEALLSLFEEDVTDDNGITPLHVAAGQGHEAVVRMLVLRLIKKGKRIDPTDRNGATPLHFAALRVALCRHRYEYLFSKPRLDTQRWSYFLDITGNRHVDVATMLLENNADPNSTDSEGQAPIHSAAKGGEIKMVGLLITHGAQIDLKDAAGCTALHLALEHRKYQVAQLLLDKGADPMALDKKGTGTIHYACNVWNVDLNILQRLLESGADTNCYDKNGSTPLHIMTKVHPLSYQAAELLLQWNARVDLKDGEGCTPVHHTASTGRREMMELLLKHGASVNERDAKGCTALHRVAKGGNINVLELVYKQCADINARNGDGHTALDLAEQELTLYGEDDSFSRRFTGLKNWGSIASFLRTQNNPGIPKNSEHCLVSHCLDS